MQYNHNKKQIKYINPEASE